MMEIMLKCLPLMGGAEIYRKFEIREHVYLCIAHTRCPVLFFKKYTRKRQNRQKKGIVVFSYYLFDNMKREAEWQNTNTF